MIINQYLAKLLESLDCQVVLLMGIFLKPLYYRVWNREGRLTQAKPVHILALPLQLPAVLLDGNGGRG